MHISNDVYFKPKFESVQTVTEKVPEYEGEYNIIPTSEEQILPTSGRKLNQDISIGGVEMPETYTGAYTVTPTAAKRTLATAGKLMTDNVVIYGADIPANYTGSYEVYPKSTNQALSTASRKLTKNVTIYRSYEDAMVLRSGTSIVNRYATSIGQYAFYKFTTLTTATFYKITTINAYAFSGCTDLSRLNLNNEDKVVALSNVNAFNGTPFASGSGIIYVPEELYSKYVSATNWATFADIIRPIPV